MVEKQWQTVISEQALVARARAGEHDAFDHLFAQHKDRVYACLWHLLGGDSDLVEEAVGNVFLDAFRGLSRFRGDAAFSTWLYRIAVNEARARLKQRSRWRAFRFLSIFEPSVANEATPQATDPAARVLQNEEERVLWKAVGALPEPYRTPIVLRYMSGLESPEIASALRRPAGTVRYQLSRGLQILRERLGSEWIK